MKKWKVLLYRAGLKCYPTPPFARKKSHMLQGEMDAALGERIAQNLKNVHAVGAAVTVFDKNKTGTLCYGHAVYPDLTVRENTYFRAASVSKLITAMAAFRLAESGKIDLDKDVSPYLGFELRHPNITLRRLMSHTAGIRDGASYTAACRDNRPLNEVMQEDCYGTFGTFEYSNLGAGIVACVLEGMLGKSFEAIMQETLFQPLGVSASFYPQTLTGDIADAYRVLPPKAAPQLDNKKRRARPLPEDKPDPMRRYLLSQGNLYITAPDLAKIGLHLTKPRYAPMRKLIAPFGARAYNLSEGLGTFIVDDKDICPQLLYGHQGLAYGAVHGLFYDPDAQRGVAILTSGCSEARLGVLADVNKEIMKQVFK